MTMKPNFCILFVFAIVLVVGCGSRSSDVERIGVSNPAQSTNSETPRTITKEAPLPGTNKITPTQVQIRLPQILSQGSDEIRQLEYRISQLENTVRGLETTVGRSRTDPMSLQNDVRKLKRDVKDLENKVR